MADGYKSTGKADITAPSKKTGKIRRNRNPTGRDVNRSARNNRPKQKLPNTNKLHDADGLTMFVRALTRHRELVPNPPGVKEEIELPLDDGTTAHFVVYRGPKRYSEPSPQEEGRATGDTPIAENLRNETNTAGAKAETTQRQQKHLSPRQRKSFLAYAKANPWDSKGDILPSEHIKTKFKRWLKHGLSRGDIIDAQENLAGAYATEISRHPKRRVKELVVRPHSLPPGAKPALSSRLISELTEEERAIKRAIEREKKQRQRQRGKTAAVASL